MYVVFEYKVNTDFCEFIRSFTDKNEARLYIEDLANSSYKRKIPNWENKSNILTNYGIECLEVGIKDPLVSYYLAPMSIAFFIECDNDNINFRSLEEKDVKNGGKIKVIAWKDMKIYDFVKDMEMIEDESLFYKFDSVIIFTDKKINDIKHFWGSNTKNSLG